MKSVQEIIPGVNGNAKVPFKLFTFISLAIISLPASEAACERCFSQIKTILNEFNISMKEDLFTSLATIKICMRYKRNYFIEPSNENMINDEENENIFEEEEIESDEEIEEEEEAQEEEWV